MFFLDLMYQGIHLLACIGQVEAAGAPKVEVVASRREQKRQQMPPPPPMPPQSQRISERAPGQFQPPDWAGVPPDTAFLDVIKAGQIVDRITLRKAATVFGRYGGSIAMPQRSYIRAEDPIVRLYSTGTLLKSFH